MLSAIAIGGLTPTRMPSAKVTAYDGATNTWTFRRPPSEPLAKRMEVVGGVAPGNNLQYVP